MPILGIMASQISGHLWAPEGAYDSLATVTVPSGGLASITFAGIPSGYKHLQVRYIARDTFAATYDVTKLELNGATTGYSWHELSGNGSTASAGAGSSASYIRAGRISYANDTANTFAAGILDILDYSNTSKYKTTRLLNGVDTNGAGVALLGSGLYQSTNAVTSITFTSLGTAYAQYSSFALYGVK
jgi:hypothetical protein